jgi:hypothetical protein
LIILQRKSQHHPPIIHDTVPKVAPDERNIPRINPSIITLNLQRSLGRHSVDHKVIIAVRAVLVTLVELRRVLPETLLALFTGEYHFGGFGERVGFLFEVAFGAVEPFSAAGRADGYLGVEDVFAHCEA